ncbi:MAG TPA: cobalt-precorrin-5B (C(1))-methyltransferase [Stellaceae bacterium]|nr:cobalt-precorrin-5B (C(1))-methyltransferase [Stellaceae bacterium]
MAKVPRKILRRGWTTGACAAAAARAAFAALRHGAFPDPVTIPLPGGERPGFPLALHEMTGRGARAGIIKDAGDDPDVTHGALVIAELRPLEQGLGLRFRAGPGVGVVTRPGLVLAPGEPAINPAPRAMIAAALEEEAPGDPLDIEVTISIPGGEKLAQRTLNGRLGIEGGLSVLGTTGIVIPYSCAAWIHSIHRGIDVARAAMLPHIAAATGDTSERAVQKLYDLPEVALIDMGDFVGGTLKYLRRHPLPRVTLAGGFAKMAKLAAGHLDLHSGRSRVDVETLAETLASLGAGPDLVRAARGAAGAGEVWALAAKEPDRAGALAHHVAQSAWKVACAALANEVAIDITLFDRQGGLIGRAGP